MKLHANDIIVLDRTYRLHLINSITGIKPANLIGSKSTNGMDNVAIFSSVIHLGSNPPHLGLVMRPQTKKPKDTFRNILDTGLYTINHVSEGFIKQAHYTSAKLDQDVSEFDVMNIEKEFIDGFNAPFVKQSAVKIGMKHLENISLPNGCILIIGQVELIIYPEDAVNKEGQLDLEQYACVGISGLNNYYSLNKINDFPYVRTDEIPNFK